MKTLVIACVTCFIVASAHAQTLTEKYLKMIPSLPKDTCNITHAVIDKFMAQVSVLSDQINAEKKSLENKADNKMKNSEETARAQTMQQMGQQYGLSQEEMNKMQSGKMSEADKKAMANKMMQQQTNMSMGEVQNLSNMSETGKKAYAEAYGTEAMATAQIDSNKQKESDKAKNSYELMNEQKSLMAKIEAGNQQIINLYSVIESSPQRLQMLDNIEKMQSKWSAMVGADGGQGDSMDSLALRITSEKIKYCSLYTPQYRNALRQHYKILENSIPNHFRSGQITSELAKAQAGVGIPAECAEIGGLEAISEYLDKLENAYQYKLYFPE